MSSGDSRLKMSCSKEGVKLPVNIILYSEFSEICYCYAV